MNTLYRKNTPQMQVAMNPATGRWYRVSWDQFRYFPIPRTTAIAALAARTAREVHYLPFSRPDLMQAYDTARHAIAKAAIQSATTNNDDNSTNNDQR
jgi:predicted DNA-binding transcriptional regulator YafY